MRRGRLRKLMCHGPDHSKAVSGRHADAWPRFSLLLLTGLPEVLQVSSSKMMTRDSCQKPTFLDPTPDLINLNLQGKEVQEFVVQPSFSRWFQLSKSGKLCSHFIPLFGTEHLLCAKFWARCWGYSHTEDRHSPYSHDDCHLERKRH